MEQRLQKRFPVQLFVTFTGDLAEGIGDVVNLSVGGCAIRCDRKIARSPYLSLCVRHPQEQQPIKVELAVVRWLGSGEFGLEFIRINAAQQERLRDLLKVLDMAPGSSRTQCAEASALPAIG